MGGCVASKLASEDDVVAVCRQRKKLMKLAVQKRYALADAHCRYSHSLFAISATLKLFVARHSSPSSPFLITFPPPDLACGSPDSASSPSSDEHQQEAKTLGQPVQEQNCAFLGDFGWDFFNPFYGVPQEEVDFSALRMEEGIPELEEEEEDSDGEKVEGKCGDENVLVMNCGDAEVEDGAGRELLEGLKDVEDWFVRAYESAKHVAGLLEANKLHLTSGLEEIKENSTKLIQAITWHRSNTACKSLVASTSKNASSWSEYKNGIFDENAGMAAGSHSLTLGRLYAWEKKLYEEVKAGDGIRKLYERKCSQLRTKNVRGRNVLSLDKSRAGAKELYSRIMVAIRRAESISENIQRLTSEELQPQIIELLHGLAQSWRMMLESHETQNLIIRQVKTYDCPTYGKFSTNSHRLATLQLQAEIENWKDCFLDYIAAQKSYVSALHGWLSKFIVPEMDFSSRNGPPLYTLCRGWLSSMEALPDKRVSLAMRAFVKDVRALWVQQGEEQDQKRKVDKLAKELDKKILAYQKAECRIHVPTKLLEYNVGSDVISDKEDDLYQHQNQQIDQLVEKKETLESFRQRLETERERHNKCMQETQRTVLNGFQTGFSSIFEALVEFAKRSVDIYSDLAIEGQNLGKDLEGKEENGG